MGFLELQEARNTVHSSAATGTRDKAGKIQDIANPPEGGDVCYSLVL